MKREIKDRIVVSFSGGETSAYMINHILMKHPNKELLFVFLNTGEENEETLVFVEKCSKYFNVKIVWLEFDVVDDKVSFKKVDFESAYRSHSLGEKEMNYKNHPFRKLIERYGIPGLKSPFCSSRLKGDVLNRYLSSIGWRKKTYSLAIGIRSDEIDRCGDHYYPLVHADISKQIVNKFWGDAPFRLELKGYQGNCKTCWKKSFRKLATIHKESPRQFDFFKAMEDEFGDQPIERMSKSGEAVTVSPPFRFFRLNKLVNDIKEMSEGYIEAPVDDSISTVYQHSILHDGTELDIANGCEESCEINFD